MASAGRQRLTGLIYYAAVSAGKQGRSVWVSLTFASSPPFSPSPAHRSFFSSFLEHNGVAEYPPSPSTPFISGLIGTPHTTTDKYLAPAAAQNLPSIPHALKPASICQHLCIHDLNSRSQNEAHDASLPVETEMTCKNTCACVSEPVAVKKKDPAEHKSPWRSGEVINWPNAISFGRLLSGPLLGWLIVQGLPQPALVGLIIAGASDWLDGYIARRQGIDSVFGTYLDPLADKVLIGCVALSMAHAGYLPSGLVAFVIARDAVLIGGSFIRRAHTLNWQPSSLRDFFNIAEGGVQKVKPLYISKINTVFQLALVCVALMQPAFGFEDTYSLVPLLSWAVAFTTCASSVGYGWMLFRHCG